VIFGRSFPLFTVLFGAGLLFFSNICAENNIITSYAQPLTPSSPSANTGLPTIQITSPEDGQQVPPGELTIQGISSDDEEMDCQVYADVNDITPLQNVTAAGDSREENDFSKWTFTYTQDYQLIKQGENELTAKISCTSAGPGTAPPSSPLSEWHTVNVTGVAGAAAIPLPLPSLSSTEEIDEPNEASSNNEDEESEEGSGSDTDDVDNDNGDDDSNDGLFGGDSFFN
jgi:hypothetical protein